MAKTVEEIKQEIQGTINELVERYKKYREERFEFSKVATFAFEVGSKLVETVENIKGITGEQKKEVVMSTVKEVYKKVNPDIPWIPEPFETWIEDILLDKALDAFIDFIVSKYDEKGIFK